MKIKMLQDAPGSEDGFTVKDYEAGKEYEVGEALGRAFVGAEQAEEIKAKPAAEKPAPSRKAK